MSLMLGSLDHLNERKSSHIKVPYSSFQPASLFEKKTVAQVFSYESLPQFLRTPFLQKVFERLLL